MRRTLHRVAPAAVVLLVALLSAAAGGCQSARPEVVSRLAAHVSMVDFAGLAPAKAMSDVKATAAVPARWESAPVQGNALFTHHMWRSGNRGTGVGVAHVNLPLPVSAQTLVWLAKARYAQVMAAHGGQISREWTDAIGREWFEGETDKYHVQGYAVTSGFDAWVVYTGYKLHAAPNPVDISLGFRAVDSVVPFPLDKHGDPSERE